MKNCFVQHMPGENMLIGIADLTNIGEMVPGTMTITRINIPAAHRGKGLGSALLKQILDAADADQVLLSLEIQPSGPLDYDQLRDWYVRHGFYELGDLIGVFVRHPKEPNAK